MEQGLFWVVVATLVIAFPLIVVALNEKRLRRRQRVLGTRRKRKLRL